MCPIVQYSIITPAKKRTPESATLALARMPETAGKPATTGTQATARTRDASNSREPSNSENIMQELKGRQQECQ